MDLSIEINPDCRFLVTCLLSESHGTRLCASNSVARVCLEQNFPKNLGTFSRANSWWRSRFLYCSELVPRHSGKKSDSEKRTDLGKSCEHITRDSELQIHHHNLPIHRAGIVQEGPDEENDYRIFFDHYWQKPQEPSIRRENNESSKDKFFFLIHTFPNQINPQQNKPPTLPSQSSTFLQMYGMLLIKSATRFF